MSDKQDNNRTPSQSVLTLLLKYFMIFIVLCSIIVGIGSMNDETGLGSTYITFFSMPVVFVICLAQGMRELEGTGKAGVFMFWFIAAVAFLLIVAFAVYFNRNDLLLG